MLSFAVNKQVQRHDTTSNNNNRSLCTDVNINYFGLLARGSATPGLLTVVVVPRGKLKSERGIIFFFPLLKDAGSSRGSRRDISKQTGNRLEGRIYFPAQTGVDTRQPDSLMITSVLRILIILIWIRIQELKKSKQIDKKNAHCPCFVCF